MCLLIVNKANMELSIDERFYLKLVMSQTGTKKSALY